MFVEIFDHKAKQFWLRGTPPCQNSVFQIHYESALERQRIVYLIILLRATMERLAKFSILTPPYIRILTRKSRQIETLFKNIFYLFVKGLIDENFFSKNLVTHFL